MVFILAEGQRMLFLNESDLRLIAGGIWCTYEGKPCSDCANLIEVAGNDCSVIIGQQHVQKA